MASKQPLLEIQGFKRNLMWAQFHLIGKVMSVFDLPFAIADSHMDTSAKKNCHDGAMFQSWTMLKEGNFWQ